MSDQNRMRIAGAAVVAGLLLGLWGALAQNPFAQWGGSDSIAASVNDAVVTRDDLTLAVEAVASDKRNEMTQADRERILSRLIDEELLIQRGIEVGLLDSDTTVRKAIVNAMIISVLDDAAAREPTQQDLEALYAESPALFSSGGRYHAAQLFVRDADGSAETIAAISAGLSAGGAFSTIATRHGDHVNLPLPDAPLPLAKLREYTGPTAAAAIAQLQDGEVTGPLPVPGGVSFFMLKSADPGLPRPFAQVKPLLEAEFRRRRDDDALRQYLDWLWTRADIEFSQGHAAKPELRQ